MPRFLTTKRSSWTTIKPMLLPSRTSFTGHYDSTVRTSFKLQPRLGTGRLITSAKNRKTKSFGPKNRLEDRNIYRIGEFALESLRGVPAGPQYRQRKTDFTVFVESFGELWHGYFEALEFTQSL